MRKSLITRFALPYIILTLIVMGGLWPGCLLLITQHLHREFENPPAW
jgi:K+-transporting ATPase c subunit